MAIETIDNVVVTTADWVQVSASKVLLYINHGVVRLVFSTSKPSVDTGGKGIELHTGDAFENSVGGTIWGRSVSKGTGSISVTTLE